jgi:hypothetical protein
MFIVALPIHSTTGRCAVGCFPCGKIRQSNECHILDIQYHHHPSSYIAIFQVLSHFVLAIERIDPQVYEWKKDLLVACLAKIKTRILSFEETDVMLREILSDLYMDEEEYIEAAKTLAAINLESSARYYIIA